MSTSYHITVGYNSGFKNSEVESLLRSEVERLCSQPKRILEEVQRVEGYLPDKEYGEHYRQPWQDLTIRYSEAEPENDLEFAVIQSASGGGNSREVKEAMRRAFCRLILEAMNRHHMEVNIHTA